MLYIAKVTMKSGSTKFAIKDVFSKKTVRSYDFLRGAMAYFDTFEEAENFFDDLCAEREMNAM